MLRKTVKHKVFLQDLQHNSAHGPSSNDGMWPSDVCDVNMNISVSVSLYLKTKIDCNKLILFDFVHTLQDELSKMMSSKCLIEKGRWMLPQECMIGKVNYKFAVIGYSYDPSDGRHIGCSASDRSMYGSTIANEIGRQSIEVDKSDTIEMKQSNDAQMMFGMGGDDTRKCAALNLSKCVKKLFDEPNAQHSQGTWPSQRCSELNRMDGYDVSSSQRSQLKGELNGNVSYSYRTHYFLNR